MWFNYNVILLLLVLITTGAWIADRFFLRPKREALAKEMTQNVAAPEKQKLYKQVMQRPWYLEYTAGLCGVVLVVFSFRSFLYEPFRIPSGSMIPTLQVGDFVLVNKFVYGMRFPVFNFQLTPGSVPERGDVIVFRPPHEQDLNFIKRLIGLPGDVIEYDETVLKVNGVTVETKAIGNDARQNYEYVDENTVRMDRYAIYDEFLPGRAQSHAIQLDQSGPSRGYGALSSQGGDAFFTQNGHCKMVAQKVTCTIPKDRYFMMGDNRDNSEDSRFWGLASKDDIVGRADLIWMNLTGFSFDFSRIGKKIN